LSVYLLYANARLESIITKAKAEFNVYVDELIANKTEIVIGHPSERNLVLQLLMFTDTLALTLEDLFPYHICEYVYNISIAASDFCTQCKVLASPEMNSRLLLCRATTMAMRECFDLLGIRHVDRI
jgi:arginyl-tRNA synthetase